MIYEGLNRTGEIESVKAHGGGDVAEVYGGLNETDPIFYKSRTITGTPPLSFKALGKPLSDYLISGNTVQNGTPTPIDPVDVQGCGERTENLFDKSTVVTGKFISANGETATASGSYSDYIPVSAEATYYITGGISLPNFYTGVVYDANKQPIGNIALPRNTNNGTITIPSDGAYIRFNIYANMIDTAMLNLGSTALPYEPYGQYKLPITCGGVTSNIYIGNYPLNKSANVADDVQYSTQTLTRRIDPETLEVLATPTTEQITVPQISTTAGSNTLSVGTTVQPSQVSITGNIKPTT